MSLKHLFIVIGNLISTRLWATCVKRRIVTYEDDEIANELTAGAPFEEFWQRWSAEFPSRFFYSPRNKKDFFLHTLQSLHPYEEILDDANAVAAHTFDLLGSGPVTLPSPIAWNVDFKTGAAWDGAFYTKVRQSNSTAGGDIKVPWELGRFQYLVWLGKGYWVSNSRRYADAFRELVESWIGANPMCTGVQWSNAMEVALRACNWIAGMAFFLEEPSLPAEFWRAMLVSLWKHAEFIEDNLEVTRRSGNHLIADYAGLAFIGACLHHTIEGKRWMIEGVRGMEREILAQSSVDGVDYEKSIAYHRFVTEMAMAVMLLCKHMRVPFGNDAAARVERMCEFTMHYTRGDGSAPNIGDSDNGRLFRVRSEEDFLDHTALLSTAAVAFDRADFKTAARRFAEETVWLTGTAGWERYMALGSAPALLSHAFPEGGFHILCSSDVHCIVDTGELGKRGWGGHGHNDTLSFELWRGEPVIVDSGTFCYTADPEQRNRYRGTAAHNTAMVDGAEIADFAGLFKVKLDATNPVVQRWIADADRDILEVAHYGYSRLADPVVHTRTFTLDKRENLLTIRDAFTARRPHTVSLRFHFAHAIALRQISNDHIEFQGKTVRGTVTSTRPWVIAQDLISTGYGTAEPALVLVCTYGISEVDATETSFTLK